MALERYEGYDNRNQLKRDVQNLDQLIDNIGNDNIINSSKVQEIESEIDKIEGNIKVTKINNKINLGIRNLKIFGRALQGIGPYVIVAGLVFGAFTLFGEVPFYPQKEFKVAQHEQIIDNTRTLSDKVTYVGVNSKPINSAHYSTKWEKKEDGRYYRMIKEYNIGDYTIEDLKEIIKNPELDFDTTFGKNTSIKYEVKEENQITKEDLEEGTGFKIVYRYTDEEDVILGAQDIGPNLLFSFLYLALTALPTLGVIAWRIEDSDFDFMDYVEEYKDDYEPVDTKELEQLFKEKKIKFEKVRHQEISLIDPLTKEKVMVKR